MPLKWILARIQSFPDEFILNNSESKSYKQIGNAIPPVLMWHIAKALQDVIFPNKELSVAETSPSYGHSKVEPSNSQYSFNYEYNPIAGTLFNEPEETYESTKKNSN